MHLQQVTRVYPSLISQPNSGAVQASGAAEPSKPVCQLRRDRSAEPEQPAGKPDAAN